MSQNTSVEVMQAIEDDFSSHRDSPLHTQVSEYERCRGGDLYRARPAMGGLGLGLTMSTL